MKRERKGERKTFLRENPLKESLDLSLEVLLGTMMIIMMHVRLRSFFIIQIDSGIRNKEKHRINLMKIV